MRHLGLEQLAVANFRIHNGAHGRDKHSIGRSFEAMAALDTIGGEAAERR